jgi:endogenous inhibitor of DNA gyrase (YacG/DUF329 family)
VELGKWLKEEYRVPTSATEDDEGLDPSSTGELPPSKEKA